MNETPEAHSDTAPSSETGFPTATIHAASPRRPITRLWWVTGLCLLLAVGLTAYAVHTRGYRITVHFADGHGIKPGASVQYRGIEVGRVTAVGLNATADGVDVQLVLSSPALTRQGSHFWIERPQVSLAQVRGLDTLVGGRYIAVVPGPDDAPLATMFAGLDSAPHKDNYQEGGLEIILYNAQRHGLAAGAPVLYRGLKVGHIITVGLSVDASRVEARAFIQPAYKRLVRRNSQFWSVSGIDASFTPLKGLQLEVDTLSTIVAGGVAFATPEEVGEQVITGQEMPFHARVKEDWLAWKPRLSIGNALLPNEQSLPRPWRVSLQWQKPMLNVGGLNTGSVLGRSQQRQGWVIILSDQRILGPADLLRFDAAANAVDDVVILAVAGRQFALARHSADPLGPSLALRTLPIDIAEPALRWPLARIRAPEPAVPEDSLIVAGSPDTSFPLLSGRMQVDNGAWAVDPSLHLETDWHGASVLSLRDGKLIGFLLVADKQGQVVPIPSGFLEAKQH